METYLMQPWIKMSSSNIMVIPTVTIVAAVDITDSAYEQYIEYLDMGHQVNTEIFETQTKKIK